MIICRALDTAVPSCAGSPQVSHGWTSLMNFSLLRFNTFIFALAIGNKKLGFVSHSAALVASNIEKHSSGRRDTIIPFMWEPLRTKPVTVIA